MYRIDVTLDAVSNMLGIDFELYHPYHGSVPFFIKTSFNPITMDQSLKLMFFDKKFFILFYPASGKLPVKVKDYRYSKFNHYGDEGKKSARRRKS